MNILLYTSILSSGGAERVLCALANHLAEWHKVTLVIAYPTENEYAVSDQVKRVYIDDSAENKHSFRQIRRLRKLCRTEKPDICISFLPQPNFKMLMATRGLPTKVLISVRNDPKREYATRVNRMIAKWVYPFADGVVFQTADAQAWFPEEIRRKSRIILNQVDAVFYNTPLAPNRCGIVTTGRLSSQKNHALLLRAFARASTQTDNTLTIYGEGNLRGELESLAASLGIAERVYMPGNISDVPAALRSAEAFVLSSDFEGMPNALMEAMAMGLPCISTDCPCGGPRAIIHNDDYFVAVGDEDAMTEKLHRLITDAAWREQNAAWMREKSARFEPERIFAEWVAYLEEIVGEKTEDKS